LSVISDNGYIVEGSHVKKAKAKMLQYYATKNREVPFLEWLKNLKDSTTQVRIRRRLDRIEKGNFGDCAPVGEGISELRLFFGSGYRVYFAERNDEIIILLCGGDKSSQKKDIKLAKSYWQDLKERSDE
jgi:putative addiction module killer protein